jgi:drug/metabolite transporter (DMT)-like permease
MSDNLRASLLMILAMSIFAANDAVFKHFSQGIPGGVLMITAGTIGIIALLIWGFLKGESIWTKGLKSPAFLLRLLAEYLSTICGAGALMLIPLTQLTAIAQAIPIVVTLAAVLWLKERLTAMRLFATLTGFVGVLLVLDPFDEEFKPAALLALASVFAVALRDVVTRALPREIPSYTLIFWSHVTAYPAGLTLLYAFGQSWVTPSAGFIALYAVAVLFGLMGGVALIAAVRGGQASFVAPFRYSRILVAFTLGALFFKEEISLSIIAGSCLLILAGVAVFRHEARQPVAA